MADTLCQIKNHAPTGPMSSPASSAFTFRTLLAGTTASAVTLAVLLSLGLLAFAPAGASAAPLGLGAVLATCLLSAPLFGLLARTSLPFGGPSSALAIVMASLVAQVLARRPDAGPALLVAACGLAVAGMGALQLAMGLLRLGRLASWVPQPVMSGFMNGIALHVLLGQWPVMSSHAAAGALALATAAAIWLTARRWPQAPVTLMALAGAAVLVQAWPALAAAVGPSLQAAQAVLPPLPLLAPQRLDLAGLAAPVALHALLLALTGSLEALVSQRAIDQQRGERSDPNRLLLAAGAANLAGGLAGALPVTLVRTAATAVMPSGERGAPLVLVAAAISALVFALAGPLLRLLPQAAVAGVMLTIGVALADRWSRALLQRAWRARSLRENRQSLAIVAAVGATTAFVGTAAGIGLGIVLATVAFLRGMRGQVIRHQTDAVAHPSRRVWPPADEALLAPQRHRIHVIELQGALFFASAERLLDACDALPADTRFAVLDLRRVSTLDDTGATTLHELRPRLARRGVTLLLAAVDPARAHGRMLAALGGTPADGWFADADRAIEHAERALLAEAATRAAATTMALADTALLDGLAPDAAAQVERFTERRELAAGEAVFRHGDPGDALYVVTRGSISVVSANGRHRFTSFSPGTVFGEMALLDGGGRTADAVADEPTELLRLPAAALQELERQHPDVAAQVFRNLALHLSQRLRAASAAWQAAAG